MGHLLAVLLPSLLPKVETLAVKVEETTEFLQISPRNDFKN